AGPGCPSGAGRRVAARIAPGRRRAAGIRRLLAAERRGQAVRLAVADVGAAAALERRAVADVGAGHGAERRVVAVQAHLAAEVGVAERKILVPRVGARAARASVRRVPLGAGTTRAARRLEGHADRVRARLIAAGAAV